MPKSVVIAEKPSQARDISAAIRTAYGTVLSAQGHIMRLELPPEENPDWAKWTPDALLLPASGRYKTVPDRGQGKGARLDAIRAALKDAAEVVIATDCDREGMLLGYEILDYLKFRGTVRRAIFTAQDPTTLKKAFANLEDIGKHMPLYDAGVARQQGDQIYNLTLTRVATNNLRKNFGDPVIGVGRVKTPTMGIVCRREIEIRNFKPTDYFVVAMTVKGAAGTAILTHQPPDTERITDKTRAEAIRAAAATFKGPVKVEVKRKAQTPPRPYDLPSLQKVAGTKFGWTAQRTLNAAQSLYETYKITTYPRGECRYLPENMIPDASPLLSALKAIPDYKAYPLASPQIRKGKSGLYCDKQLEGFSHHAIIPNINCPDGIAPTAAKLTGDEKILFDLIARAFLAAIGDDQIYDATSISADVPTPAPSPRLFKTTGKTIIKPGWLTIRNDPDEDPNDDESGVIPPLKNGEIVTATKAAVEARQTKPPSRYSEGALIEAMQNAWKFIADPVERDRLKDAKGIGTPATRGSILEELKHQNLLTPDSSRKYIVPTAAGLGLYKVFATHAPALLDPGSTARMETRLDDVAAGHANADEVIREMASLAAAVMPKLQAAGKADKIDNAAQARPKLSGAGKVASTRPGQPKPGSIRTSSIRTGGSAPGNTAPAKSTFHKPTAGNSATSHAGTLLRVPFDRKDEAKALGARWDSDAKAWRAPPGADLAPFKAKGFAA